MDKTISNINATLIDTIADTIATQFEGSIGKVGIDGFCASGKTTIAHELQKRLQNRQRVVVSATSDDFMNPSEIRWGLGKDSPLGFYKDAIDFDAIARELLFPLGREGNKKYRTSTYDVQKSKTNYSEQKEAHPDTILIFDGLFLQVPQLRNLWDMVIYVEANYDACIYRAKERNQEKLHSQNEIEEVYLNRYVPGFELYLQEVDPRNKADFIIDTE
ncbi:MAG: AAA family ATPase [Bacteroidota bacterium]